MKFLLIDGSYYVFYRFHAIKQWWKNAHPREEIGIPHENPVFMETFKRTFITKFREIPKKLKLGSCVTLVGQDCPRSDIWRSRIYPDYKGTRDNGAELEIEPFFQVAYNSLIDQTDNQAVLYHDELEADDCLALTTNHIVERYPDAEVYIITSDADYLQLASERVHLYDLKFKNLRETRSFQQDAETTLFCKIMMGDKSDNIQPIFKGCGLQTALKLKEKPELLREKLNNPEIMQRYQLNKTLIDFSYIPIELAQSFHATVLKL